MSAAWLPSAETELVSRAVAGPRAGREAAFAEIFDGLCEQVFAVCVNVTGNPADAEDAMQEAFIAVHKSLSKFRGRARLSTWVHRIAIRAALRIRSRRSPSAASLAADAPASPAEDPLERADLAAQVDAAMRRLPATHRVVLSLFAIDGLPHGQIAEILGIPEGTAWSRLHTARRRMASELSNLTP
jgi:RNA polymerase sigma-70 factor (ECF subfamily)